MSVRDLLIEIGVEELPASFIEPAVTALAQQLKNDLLSRRIEVGEILPLATPRRLAVLAKEVPETGRPGLEIVTGPPRKTACDGSGQWSKAALGFARSQGLDPTELKVANTPKGEYLSVERTLAGLDTRRVLPEVIPRIVIGLPFPKSMRWGEGDLRFARPIHWLVVLFGEEAVEVRLGGLKSGRVTFGHRFLAPGPIELKSPADYSPRLESAFVVTGLDKRREMTRQAVEAAATAASGQILPDEDLLRLNANLVEYPSAVAGRFEDKFLSVPQAAVITAMREHQKYFAVTDDRGRLKPIFVAVNNTLAKDAEVVRKGHERVLRARLSDAAFFVAEDLKVGLKSRLEILKKIVYHRDLGTSYEKVERFVSLTAWLADRLAPEAREKAVEAAWLSKCDLTTAMVGEFPTLQGVIGQDYALKQGLHPLVAAGIREHYLPTSPESPCPESLTGALVGLADKMDTIAGFFAINLTPTGAADPYGLRRAALGIIRVLLDRGWRPGLAAFIRQALAGYLEQGFRDRTAKFQGHDAPERILDFFRGRLLNLFTGQGLDHDVVEAVLDVSLDDPHGVALRVKALQDFKKSESFAQGAVAFKRLFNILKGQTPPPQADPARFQEPQEGRLLKAALDISDSVQAKAQAGDFEAVLAKISSLKPEVDAFFDAVLVMAEDETLRLNRLALVAQVAGLFRLVADFSKLQAG